VPLTVLAPAEIVPANPELIRAPLEGVIDRFYVQPNDPIKKGQPLFSFDERLIKSRLDVSIQSLGIAEAEYRQAAQLALSDNQAKLNLANLAGQIQERRVEVAYIRDQLSRSQVAATRDGIALLDDPSAWIGRPVSVGEQVMRIASLDDKEIEAWIGISDLIPMEPQNPVQMYLNSNPLRPVTGAVRYLGYDPVARPDGTLAYRLRARLTTTAEEDDARIGARGTVKIEGPTVLAAYWVFRRPWSALQSHLGI
jgi:multidrug efflux pump subunit AcrA (membrane-fusion protein)